MGPLELDNAFWQFSLRVYGAPGVAEECLELQDKLGLDVNVVLFVAWLGAARGVALAPADFERIDDAVAVWSADIVRPLRAIRRTLKVNQDMADPEMQALRKRIAGTELQAEQIEQALLHRLAGEIGRPAIAGERAVRANVGALFDRRGVERDAFPLPRLFAESGRPGDA